MTGSAAAPCLDVRTTLNRGVSPAAFLTLRSTWTSPDAGSTFSARRRGYFGPSCCARASGDAGATTTCIRDVDIKGGRVSVETTTSQGHSPLPTGNPILRRVPRSITM